jgi:uncharacterized RDD family membrane protein YckC
MSAVATESVFELQSRRVKAAWIDLAVIFALSIAFAFPVGQHGTDHITTMINGRTQHSTLRRVDVSGWRTPVWLAVLLGYYFVTEVLAGQTLGKRLMGVRVVTLSGAAPVAGRYACSRGQRAKKQPPVTRTP